MNFEIAYTQLTHCKEIIPVIQGFYADDLYWANYCVHNV